ncbi:MAG: phosphotransferase [Corynebacterium sp.]|uniref:phosphotransferase family protein n=1 Tax=Corynebacterium sp. TaxID=1720 RepID=UPI0026DC0DAE|nr:phosphotransferase [Corynebacterium sp.]MDO5098327.1 phosphotransferase [Corynebacterium sp.]
MTPIDVLFSLPHIVRAWPNIKNHSLTFEQLVDGQLRAGEIDANGNVVRSPFGFDPKLPALEPHPGLVVHRLHRRAVVIDADRCRAIKHIAKAAPPDLSAVAKAAGLGAAEIVAQTESTVEYSLLSGKTLLELGDDSLPGWRKFAELWPSFARTPHVPLPSHGAAEERATLQHWLRQVESYQALTESVFDGLRGSVEKLATELLRTPDVSMLLHRDLHDKQLLWDGATISVLDLDTAAYGEAALDVGNLLAHVELRGYQGVYSSDTQSRITEELFSLAHNLNISDSRLRVYTQSARLRLCCVYAFRPSAKTFFDQWIYHTLEEKQQ